MLSFVFKRAFRWLSDSASWGLAALRFVCPGRMPWGLPCRARGSGGAGRPDAESRRGAVRPRAARFRATKPCLTDGDLEMEVERTDVFVRS